MYATVNRKECLYEQYKLFRSFGRVDKDVKKHELIGVEDGVNIHDVTDRLIKWEEMGIEPYGDEPEFWEDDEDE